MGGRSFWEGSLLEKYGKTAVFPHCYGRVGVYRVAHLVLNCWLDELEMSTREDGFGKEDEC